ncbi:MAG: hypothetical protein AB7O50_15130 [Pseudolabrys sp.]
MLRAAAATVVAALALAGCWSDGEPWPDRAYEITLEADKDYFAEDWVRVIALSKAKGEVLLDSFDVTIQRTRTVTVPGDARELVFRTKARELTARLKLGRDGGRIVIRPVSTKGSIAGVGWMLGRRGVAEVEALSVELVK